MEDITQKCGDCKTSQVQHGIWYGQSELLYRAISEHICSFLSKIDRELREAVDKDESLLCVGASD